MSWFRGMYEISVSYLLVSYYLACLKNVYCPLAGTSAYQMTWLTHLGLLSEMSSNLNSNEFQYPSNLQVLLKEDQEA